MRIMFVGGGTGGHFYPLIAVAEQLRATHSDTSLYYIGPEPYNRALLQELDIRFVQCPSGKRRRYFSFANILDTFKVAVGVLVAIVKLYAIYPDVIFSKGSYTSVPVVLAAAFLRIPIVVHESDATPGSANKLGAKFARYIAISYDDAAQFFPEGKTALTGIPIRQRFLEQHPDPRAVLQLPPDLPVIFVTGGSLGAERVNLLILDSLDELLPQYILIHQTGDTNKDTVVNTALARQLPSDLLERYFVYGHMSGEEMAAAYEAASLVIARAGSTSITELSLKHKPAILIPIPEEISHDQRTNAYAYARTGAASVMEEKNLTDGLLTAEINRILTTNGVAEEMAAAAARFTTPQAASTLANTLYAIAAEH